VNRKDIINVATIEILGQQSIVREGTEELTYDFCFILHKNFNVWHLLWHKVRLWAKTF
jgi:hypothetical protein